MSGVLDKDTRAILKEKARRRKERNGRKRRTTTPTALPKTVTAILLRNGGDTYDPANDPDAPLHLRHGDAPEWSYRGSTPGAIPVYDANYHPFAAVQVLAEGASMIELALEFGVYPSTIYSWLKTHEEFKLAVEHGRLLTKAWWLREGRKALSNPRFNNALYALHMANRFGWTKKSETVLQGALPSPDEIIPPELRGLLTDDDDDEPIDVDAMPETADAGRSAEILHILMKAGALPAHKPKDDDEE